MTDDDSSRETLPLRACSPVRFGDSTHSAHAHLPLWCFSTSPAAFPSRAPRSHNRTVLSAEHVTMAPAGTSGSGGG